MPDIQPLARRAEESRTEENSRSESEQEEPADSQSGHHATTFDAGRLDNVSWFVFILNPFPFYVVECTISWYDIFALISNTYNLHSPV